MIRRACEEHCMFSLHYEKRCHVSCPFTVCLYGIFYSTEVDRHGLRIQVSGYLRFQTRHHAKGRELALCHATALQLTLSMAPY